MDNFQGGCRGFSTKVALFNQRDFQAPPGGVMRGGQSVHPTADNQQVEGFVCQACEITLHK